MNADTDDYIKYFKAIRNLLNRAAQNFYFLEKHDIFILAGYCSDFSGSITNRKQFFNIKQYAIELISQIEKLNEAADILKSQTAEYRKKLFFKIIEIVWKIEIEFLNQPIEFLKGIGPKSVEYYKKKEINTIRQILFYLPSKYIQYNPAFLNAVEIGGVYAASGKIIEIKKKYVPNQKSGFIDIKVCDGAGIIVCRFFGNPHFFSNFVVEGNITIFGEVQYYNIKMMVNPTYKLEKIDIFNMPVEIIPVYSLPEGLKQQAFKKSISIALELYADIITDFTPRKISEKYAFPKLRDCLKSLHSPVTMTEIEIGKKQCVSFLFYEFQIYLQMHKHNLYKKNSPRLDKKKGGLKIKEIISELPFTLTDSQINAVKEIIIDLDKILPMRRLLQGDVGCGKTVVALLSAVFVVENGCQAVIMAPSEILAAQHFETFKKYLEKSYYNICLLTSKTPKKTQADTREKIKKGFYSIIIGTHSLIQDSVEFKNPGLIVIDEQQRFGVAQRAVLTEADTQPHLLMMSATPIPRTLAQTIFADFDITEIPEKPKNRKPIITKIYNENNIDEVWNFIRNKAAEKIQSFIVYPLIDESEKLELKSLLNEFERISTTNLKDIKCGLLHGKMCKKDIDEMMKEFIENRIQVLFSTIIIEVGVDIPNAGIMAIQHPERFGLAQLHQLRGRIGRNSMQSYCFPIVQENLNTDSLERIKIFESNIDGFKLAQFDLSDRGMGDLSGARQSGLTHKLFKEIIAYSNLAFEIKEFAVRSMQTGEFFSSVKSNYFKLAFDNKCQSNFEFV